MRDYELLYIINGGKTEDEATKVTDEVNAALQRVGAKVTNEDVWGRKRLAYEVAKQDHGWYVITRISIEAEKTRELDQALRLNRDLLRTMLVSTSELPTKEEAEKTEEIQAQADADKTKASPRSPRKAPATVVPETAATAKPAKPAKPAEEKKPETADEKKAREAKLAEALDKISKEDE